MPKIKDIIRFKKESFFNGAVQADWFYNDNYRNLVSKSYMFHSSKYFGVLDEEVKNKKNLLIDTITFTKNIVDRIYKDEDSNKFVLAIAGYGLGKSHLAVTLASLLSYTKNDHEFNEIIKNIALIDKDASNYLYETINKPNFVVVLNGMKDFNLNYEILRTVKQSLNFHGLEDNFLKEISKAYEIARYFINNNFGFFYEKFYYYSSKTQNYKLYEFEDLKNKILENLEKDIEAFEIINRVYKEVNGNYIRWDEGISAGDILLKVKRELCDKRKLFKNVVVIFDEFGRYIEYAATNPTIAGESALQQIFEAVQNAENKILFIGFIQSDLSAYLARIEKATNIIRYLGRYESSDKYYLTSNLETIIANLLLKVNENLFKDYIEKFNESNDGLNKIIFENINRWANNFKDKNIWSDYSMYKKILLNGCFPFHPLTIWMLSKLSTWMQQRSSLVFVNRMIENNYERDILFNNMPYIYPIELINSEYFEELYNAEEKGRQPSQYCINYKQIISKYSQNLSETDKKILQAILLINLLKLNTFDKNDTIAALKYLSGIYDEEDIKISINSLENILGIITYNDVNKKFEFLIETNGLIEFKKELLKKQLMIKNCKIEDMFDEELLNELNISNYIETAFSLNTNNYSDEWKFSQVVIELNNITKEYINYLIHESKNTAWDVDGARGKLVWIYTNDASKENINRLSLLIEELAVNKYPIIFQLINDADGELFEALKYRQALKKFDLYEREKFKKYISKELENNIKKIKQKFNDLALNRIIITENGREFYEGRLSKYCTDVFAKCYNKTIPFVFDGFQKKLSTQTKKLYLKLIRFILTNGYETEKWEIAEERDFINRIIALFFMNSAGSWKMMDNYNTFHEPYEKSVREIYNELFDKLKNNKSIKGVDLFKKYIDVPYGLNGYILLLLIVSFISLNKKCIKIRHKGERKKINDIIEELLADKKFNIKSCCEEFFKYEYVFENDDENKSVFNELIHNIVNTTSVSDCLFYKQKIDEFIEDNELSPEQSEMYKFVEAKIKEAQDLYEKQNKQMETIKDLYNKFKDKFSLVTAAQILKYVNLDNIKYKSNFNFNIDYEYYEFCKTIYEEISNEINNNAEEFINNLTCKNLYSLSEFKRNYINVIEELKKNKFNEIAISLENRLNKIIDEIQLRVKYEKFITEIDIFINLNKNIENKNYRDLVSLIKNIKEKILIIEGYKLVNYINDKYQHLIILKNIVENKIKEILEEIKLVFEEIKTVDELKDLKEIKNKINKLIYLEIPDDKKEELIQVVNKIQDLESAILSVYSNKNDRYYIETTFEKIRREHIIFTKLINKIEKELKDELNQKELSWKQNYINEVYTKLDKLNVQQCIRLINEIENYPLYLSQTTIDELENIKNKLRKRIKECKIEGVIELFKDLEYDDKIRCLQLLNAML